MEPSLPQLPNPFPVQGRRPGTGLSAFVPTEVSDTDVCEMDFGEFERAAGHDGLGLFVHAVDEYAHPP